MLTHHQGHSVPFTWEQPHQKCSQLNSLAPRRFKRKFREVIFKLDLVVDGWGISCEIVLTWMPQDLTNDKSTLVQVMAWCRQATSHYLSQCWHSSLSPYGVTRPQWVNPVACNPVANRHDIDDVSQACSSLRVNHNFNNLHFLVLRNNIKWKWISNWCFLKTVPQLMG